MKVKKYVLSILLTISICVSSLLGFTFLRAETLTADAKTASLPTQFVDFVMGMQHSLGDDSPVALIPLVNESGEMMLLVRIDANRQSQGLNKDKLVSLMFKMISENSYLAMDTASGTQYIVNKDNVPAFDLQPLFDLVTEGFESLLEVALTGIENGVCTSQCDIGDKQFADSEQRAMYASDLGMEFLSTTLYYFGTSAKPAAVDMRMTVTGNQQVLSELQGAAEAFDRNFFVERIYFDYKELNLDTRQLVGDLYFDATIDSRKYPEQIAVFVCSVAYVTSDEDLKASLVSAVKQYLSDGSPDTLKSVVGDIDSIDGINSISSFLDTPFDEVLEELEIQSDVLLQTARENRGLMSILKRVIDMIPPKDKASTFSRHEQGEGTYVFDFKAANDESRKMFIDLTVHLFEPSVRDLSKLTATINYIKTLKKSHYTKESWNALNELVEQALLLNENNTQSEIDAAVFKLEKAISQLVLISSEKLPPPDLTWLYVLLPVVVVVAGLVAVLWLVIARKKKYADNTPTVEYDIDEDLDYGLLFDDVSGAKAADNVDADGADAAEVDAGNTENTSDDSSSNGDGTDVG